MPTPTYTPLANITLGSSASSVTFSNIPNTYRDLVLVTQGLVTSGTTSLLMRFNADSGSNYSMVYMGGSGSSTNSGAFSDNALNLGVIDASSGSQNTFQIQDSSVTDKHKTVLARTDVAGWGVRAGAARWASTSAITSIEVFVSGTSLASAMTLALYGIAG